MSGWLDKPQEWRAIPREPRSPFHGGLLKERLDWIVMAGAAGKPFLLQREPIDARRKLTRRASNYRRRYSKAGFTFEVRKLPGEDAVGLWTVWQPPQQQTAIGMVTLA